MANLWFRTIRQQLIRYVTAQGEAKKLNLFNEIKRTIYGIPFGTKSRRTKEPKSRGHWSPESRWRCRNENFTFRKLNELFTTSGRWNCANNEICFSRKWKEFSLFLNEMRTECRCTERVNINCTKRAQLRESGTNFPAVDGGSHDDWPKSEENRRHIRLIGRYLIVNQMKFSSLETHRCPESPDCGVDSSAVKLWHFSPVQNVAHLSAK